MTGIIVSVTALAAALSIIMALAWLVHARSGNSGWIDTVWTFGLGIVGITAALWPPLATERGLFVAGLIALWSLRLGGHIAWRTSGKSDDPRYAALVRDWGQDASRQMFFLLQKQAVVSIPLAATLFIAARSPAPFPQTLDIVGALVFATGLLGEALADQQLRRHRGAGVCDVGLWAWSRHPNYFFEWLMWVGFAIIGLTAGMVGLLALVGPLAIYWLLTRISGIPPLEEHMLRTRGDAYRSYQQRTSAFFPWPPAEQQTGTSFH